MTTNSKEGEAFGRYDIASIDRRIEGCRNGIEDCADAAELAELTKALALRAVAESLFAIADAIRGRK